MDEKRMTAVLVAVIVSIAVTTFLRIRRRFREKG